MKTRIDVDNFGGAYGDDPNNIQKNDALFFKGEIRTLLMSNRWEQKLGLSLVDYDRTHENLTDSVHPLDSEEGFFNED